MRTYQLLGFVEEALRAHRGRARIVEVAKYIWCHHEADLRAAGDEFYTWQYDMRWAATHLRQTGKMLPANESPQGVWELADPLVLSEA